VERFMGKEDAYRIINDSIKLYEETFGSEVLKNKMAL
jgi:inorganic pyrophosphatase